MKITVCSAAVAALLMCDVNVKAQDEGSDDAELAKAEAAVVQYFLDTPNGKCKWSSRILNSDGTQVGKSMNYDLAYADSRIYWHEQPVPSGVGQKYVYTASRQLHWADYPGTPVLQSTSLSCFRGDPYLECVLHPRYLGTGLEGLVGSLIEKSSRGVFADGGLERIRAETDLIDGQEVLKGVYKRDGWDVEIYYSTTVPTLVLKTVTSAQSYTAKHKKTISFTYKQWDCGIHYPLEVRLVYSLGDHESHTEEVIVSEFDVIPDEEIETKFSLAAFDYPDGQVVSVRDESCNGDSKQFRMANGELVPMTHHEVDEWLQMRKAEHQGNQPQAATVASVPTPTATFRWFYVVAILLILACGVLYSRLKRKSQNA